MKSLVLCFALLFGILYTKAQGTLPGGFKHIIEVGRYSDYGKGYLTITDLNRININEQRIQCTYEYVDEYIEMSDNHLGVGDLILEVDGISAEGWNKDTFYKTVDGRHDIITMKIRGRNKTGIYDYITKIRPKYQLPDDIKMFGNSFASITGQTTSQERKYKLQDNISFEERHDEDYDFFPCVYYDYLITSEDPLLDKDILKKIYYGNLERNEEKPDILITIARDASESINTTYIPPSSRVVNEGSTTKTRYNYITKQNDYITTQKNRTIYEGGYTKETKTADLFLEIAALDVKKLNDKSMTHPPIVWKTTVRRHVINPTFNYSEELKAYATWMTLPLNDRNVWAEKNIYAPVGVIYSETNPMIIREVIAGSRAEKIGLKSGDILLKADMPYSNKYARKNVKKNIKDKGWAMIDTYLEDIYNIVILRNGNKMEFTLSPSYIKVGHYYLVGAN